MSIPTPHIEATNKNQIAKTVIMPGDPLRAKLIADTYLENSVQFNSVRGMLGFTGTYKGTLVSVMGSGMGIPSMGIYSYELFKFYDVDRIIRVGSCGSYSKDYNIYDVVLALDSYSESTFAKIQNGNNSNTLSSSIALNDLLRSSAQQLTLNLKESKIYTCDVFYTEHAHAFNKIRDEIGCNVIEMEAFALFSNALQLNKQASCLLTVSDSFITHEATTSDERQASFMNMIKIALNAATL